MKRIKVVLAALLAFAMMAPMALADTVVTSEKATQVGVGFYANPAEANVWEIEFPTEELMAFTVDPLKMVKGSGMYGDGIDVEETTQTSTVLFPHYVEGVLTSAKGESDPLKVVNCGSTDVKVEVNIRPTACTMKVRSAAIDSGDTDPSIAFQAGVYSPPTTTSGTGSTGSWSDSYVPVVGLNLDTTIAANAAAFETTYDGEKLIKQKKEEAKEESYNGWNSASFRLKGATNGNPNVTWTGDLTAPNLQMTWSVRNSSDEAIEVKFNPETVAGGVASTDTYIMAADCKYASPGQTVHVYVKPKDADAASPAGYVVGTAPSGIKIGATKNYITNVITNTTSSNEATICTFSNGVNSDNGTMVYTFVVPANDKDALEGFTAKKWNSGNTALEANTIEITGAPVIQKLTVTTATSAISTG